MVFIVNIIMIVWFLGITVIIVHDLKVHNVLSDMVMMLRLLSAHSDTYLNMLCVMPVHLLWIGLHC